VWQSDLAELLHSRRSPQRKRSFRTHFAHTAATGLRSDRLDRHIKERCPKLHVRKTARVNSGAYPGPSKLRPPKRRSKIKRFVGSRDEGQERFERKFIQGGLCSGR
jgi:hypothetical protein